VQNNALMGNNTASVSRTVTLNTAMPSIQNTAYGADCYSRFSVYAKHPTKEEHFVLLGGAGNGIVSGQQGCARVFKLKGDLTLDSTFGEAGVIDLNLLAYGVGGLGSVPWQTLTVGPSGDLYATNLSNGNDSNNQLRLLRVRSNGKADMNTLSDSINPADSAEISAGKLFVVATNLDATPSFRRYYSSEQSRVWEFYNTTLKHYFLTNSAAETNAILAGEAGPGWLATGHDFMGWTESPAGTQPVCRFYTSGANSHFFTLDSAECASLRAQNPGNILDKGLWTYEGLQVNAQLTPPPFTACTTMVLPEMTATTALPAAQAFTTRCGHKAGQERAW
jgi:Repeat of unknown function (DUF5648)